MSNATLVVGDKVLVCNKWLARVVEIRGSWIVVEEVGTKRRDEVKADGVKLAR